MTPRRPNLPGDPPAPGIIFGNVSDMVKGGDLAPGHIWSHQPSSSGISQVVANLMALMVLILVAF